MEEGAIYRSAADSARVAEEAVPGLLAGAEPFGEARQAQNRTRAKVSDQADVGRQPDLGLAPHCLGAQEARTRRGEIDRREISAEGTARPTAEWTAQQLIEAFPFDTAPRFLLRDGDAKFGDKVRRKLDVRGMRDLVTAPASPWHNAYVERLIGTIRREFLDNVVVLNERHLRRLLESYVTYYNEWRAHRSLEGDAPAHRPD
jgi:hypothetical protein